MITNLITHAPLLIITGLFLSLAVNAHRLFLFKFDRATYFGSTILEYQPRAGMA